MNQLISLTCMLLRIRIELYPSIPKQLVLLIKIPIWDQVKDWAKRVLLDRLESYKIKCKTDFHLGEIQRMVKDNHRWWPRIKYINRAKMKCIIKTLEMETIYMSAKNTIAKVQSINLSDMAKQQSKLTLHSTVVSEIKMYKCRVIMSKLDH